MSVDRSQEGLPHSYIHAVSQPWLETSVTGYQEGASETSPAPGLRLQFAIMVTALGETNNGWNAVLTEQNGSLSRMVYQGRPFIQRHLEVRRGLPQFLEYVRSTNTGAQVIDPSDIDNLAKEDIFSQKLQGTSLFDIESMPFEPELSADDIKRMTLMLQYPLSTRLRGLAHRILGQKSFAYETEEEARLRLGLVIFAIQKFAQPDRVEVPPTLVPLHQRFTAFFDHYMGLLTSSPMSMLRERSLVETLKAGFPWLPYSIGCYIPARLGITPHSSVGLYYARVEQSSLLNFHWREVLGLLEEGAIHAFRKGNLPAGLESYQHIDRANDDRAYTLVQSYYGEHPLRDADEEEKEEFTLPFNQLMDELGDRWQSLHQTLMASPKRRLEFVLQRGHVVERVTLTCQNDQSLIFILHLSAGQAYLTLEIGSDRRFYGFSPKMVARDAGLMYLLQIDLLESLLKNRFRLQKR